MNPSVLIAMYLFSTGVQLAALGWVFRELYRIRACVAEIKGQLSALIGRTQGEPWK